MRSCGQRVGFLQEGLRLGQRLLPPAADRRSGPGQLWEGALAGAVRDCSGFSQSDIGLALFEAEGPKFRIHACEEGALVCALLRGRVPKALPDESSLRTATTTSVLPLPPRAGTGTGLSFGACGLFVGVLETTACFWGFEVVFTDAACKKWALGLRGLSCEVFLSCFRVRPEGRLWEEKSKVTTQVACLGSVATKLGLT